VREGAILLEAGPGGLSLQLADGLRVSRDHSRSP
jgi:hypothetical protein